MLLFVIASAPAFAGPDDVAVENAWSRASIVTKRPGVAYMTIRNNEPPRDCRVTSNHCWQISIPACLTELNFGLDCHTQASIAWPAELTIP